MRLLQSFLYAAATATATWVLGPQLALPIASAWFLIPTSSFFAMHLSNYGPLMAFEIVFASVVVALLWGHKRPATGFLLGASISLLLASSRSVWAFAPAFGASCLLGIVSAKNEETFKQKSVYWFSFCVGISIFWLIATPDFLKYASENVVSRLPAQLHSITTAALAQPFFALIVTFGMLGLDQSVSKFGRLSPKTTSKLTQLFLGLIILALLFSYLLPYFKPHLNVPDIETPSKISLLDYLKKTALLCAGVFRWGQHDFYMSGTFYGGLGWLETLLPAWTTSFILLIAAVGLLCTGLQCHMTGNLKTLLGLGLMVVGLLISVALSAKGNWDESVNLHGRYLIPYHVTLITCCLSGYAFVHDLLAKSRFRITFSGPALVRWLLVYAVVVIQTTSVLFILKRYFV